MAECHAQVASIAEGIISGRDNGNDGTATGYFIRGQFKNSILMEQSELMKLFGLTRNKIAVKSQVEWSKWV
jgi:hypothetical protein